MSQPSRPIIIVTGANSGVGFGICQRLLYQLCHTSPSDAQSQNFRGQHIDIAPSFQLPAAEYDGLTLIMACRNAERAEAARTKLVQLLDTYVAKLKKQPGYDGHAEAFRKNVAIDTRELDLAVMGSVLKFATGVSQTYPYVSHLICNAGVLSLKGLDLVKAWTQVFTDFVGSMTAPVFLVQHVGELSVDGLGWVWQCNLFGHYALYRALQHRLCSPFYPHPGRVIWMSSHEASLIRFSLEDWQAKTTGFSYQSSKYQIDLLATHLDRLSLKQIQHSSSEAGVIRHFVTHPGLCLTNVDKERSGPVTNFLKIIFFYMCRYLGSLNHTIYPFKAAIGAAYLSLVPLTFITFPFSASSTDVEPAQPSTPVKFGAATDRWGTEFVKPIEIPEKEGDAATLLVKCEDLYQSFITAEVTTDYEAVTEHM